MQSVQTLPTGGDGMDINKLIISVLNKHYICIKIIPIMSNLGRYYRIIQKINNSEHSNIFETVKNIKSSLSKKKSIKSKFKNLYC